MTKFDGVHLKLCENDFQP